MGAVVSTIASLRAETMGASSLSPGRRHNPTTALITRDSLNNPTMVAQPARPRAKVMPGSHRGVEPFLHHGFALMAGDRHDFAPSRLSTNPAPTRAETHGARPMSLKQLATLNTLFGSALRDAIKPAMTRGTEANVVGGIVIATGNAGPMVHPTRIGDPTSFAPCRPTAKCLCASVPAMVAN